MSTKKADILQVRKYLNGELDAKAMHRLELEALDDPFLTDALEGFEATPKNQEENLNELAGRLQQRVEPQKNKVIAWRTWTIAASVVLVLTIGGLWLKKTPPTQLQKNNEIALKIDKPAVALKDTVAVNTPSPASPLPVLAANTKTKPALIKQGGKSVYQQEISSADKSTAAVQPTADAAVSPGLKSDDDTKETSLSEIVASTYTENHKEKDNSDSLAALAKKAHDRAALLTDSKLKGKVDGLTIITSKDAKVQFGNSAGIGNGTINGIIVGKNSNVPVIGAAIRIYGSNKSTVTDVNGYFSMPATASKQTLDIASIGFLPKQINVKSGDSLKVELSPADNSLNEVAVGYGTKKKGTSAHPQGEMAAFKKYLQTNAILPDNTITGTVAVTFTVNPDGSLTEIKIKKSLSPVADQKAIDLIKAGPIWVGNTNGQPEQVTVKVKFDKK